MSKYTGVSYSHLLRKYQSSVQEGRLRHNCGTHDTEIEAVKARDRKILEKGLKAPLQILKPLKK